MVLKKWSGYGFNGSQTPAVLRVPRSAKGRRSVRRKAGDKQMCAFDLLAAVAGELLSAKSNLSTPKSNAIKSSSTSSVAPKLEELLEEKPFRDEASVQGSHTKSLLDPKAPNHRQNTSFKEHLCMLNGTLSGPSVIGKSDVSCKDVGWMNMLDGNKDEFGYSFDAKPEVCCITERHSPCEAESRQARAVDKVRKTQQSEQRTDRNLADGSAPVLCSSRGSVQLDSGPRALVSSKCSSVVPSSNDGFHCSSSFPSSPDNLKQPTDRDDDEKSSRCTYSSTINSKALRPQRIGNRRIRKLLSSKYWRAAPTMSRNGDLPNTDVYRKSAFNGRKICYTRRRTQKSPFKRRMVFERHSILGCDAELSCECTSNLAKMDVKAEAINSCTFLREANSTSSSINGHRPSHESEDFHVNIRIKSFKVPELFIEIPETATVGSLKKMVMEAVTTIFGGGLRVGLLLQGKKVRDDNKTLLQAGIAHDDKLDNLGFSLEPNPSVQPVSVTSSGGAHLLLAYKASEPETRYKEALPPTPQSADPGKSIAHPELPLSSVVNSPESDHDSVHCPVDASLRDKATADSRALVPVPDMSIEALAMVPMPKPKRSDLAQRRARRPFSVSEVEALVQAVEKLGTGRWRDVKIRAFNNANHRTYVDLKDKWKTLVHTAKISPQQRRGEPVPQELLDRVLAAHAHWSQHQAKFSSKPSSLDARLLN